MGMRMGGTDPADLDRDFRPPKLAWVPSVSGRRPVLHWLHPGLPLLEEALGSCNLLGAWGEGLGAFQSSLPEKDTRKHSPEARGADKSGRAGRGPAGETRGHLSRVTQHLGF